MVLRIVLIGLVACGSEQPQPDPEPEPEVPRTRPQTQPETPARSEAMNLEAIRNTLAVGEQFSCALHEGKVLCWGDVSDGVVPGSDNQTRPVDVPGIDDAIAVAAGRVHAAVLHADGTITSWGDGGFGRVTGLHTDVGNHGPTKVRGIEHAVQVALAENHSCALRRDGSVWCWGRNRHGELGDGEKVDGAYEASDAVRVVGLGRATFIAAFGARTFAVVDGEVFQWGRGAHRIANTGGSGHLPIPPVEPNELPPAKIEGLRDVERIAVHRHHGLALRRDGRVLAFGSAPPAFGLGDDPPARAQPNVDLTPIVEVAGLGEVVSIATGAGHACVLLRGGVVRCWGADPSMEGAGVRGDGTHGYALAPSRLELDATEIAAGADHLLARSARGILSWGTGWAGQLGHGNTDSLATATLVSLAP